MKKEFYLKDFDNVFMSTQNDDEKEHLEKCIFI